MSTAWCVSAALLMALWFAVLSQIFAQTTSLADTASACPPRQRGCACGAAATCDDALVCIDDVCELPPTSASMANSSTAASRFNNTGTAPPEMPGLLEHEMTLLSVSMALAILLVVLYYFFYDRPASRSAEYHPIDDKTTAAIVAAADSDDDV
jgi:hypothetical protein